MKRLSILFLALALFAVPAFAQPVDEGATAPDSLEVVLPEPETRLNVKPLTDGYSIVGDVANYLIDYGAFAYLWDIRNEESRALATLTLTSYERVVDVDLAVSTDRLDVAPLVGVGVGVNVKKGIEYAKEKWELPVNWNLGIEPTVGVIAAYDFSELDDSGGDGDESEAVVLGVYAKIKF